ncbi:acyl-CoA synthetase [Enemella evansiae]|uniref:fatty acyl-CoA synthetase n=1 Tax=Enemella evansiae TaxID=2016499 RepID=UPI000B96FA35|nr:fatty acyl-CoA synthetase [Enemella evansiae]OYO03273.1 acyl-CoA synthetase [Enemella evansiae]
MTDPRVSTVDGLIRRSARRTPEAVAVRFADREWTYRELDEATSRGAAYLLGRGLSPGDRVAAYGKNSDAYLIAFLACARAGLVHVPLNYALTGGELAYLIEDSGASLVLADPALAGNLESVWSGGLVLLRDDPQSFGAVVRTGELPAELPAVADTDLVQLLYTSGTTSRPKGAMMTHRALVHEYLSCLTALDFAPDDDPLHVMPLYHSAQLHVFIMPALAIGGCNTILEVPDPGEVLRRLAEDGHRSFFAAPTLWVAMANHESLAGLDLAGVEKCYYGASIMPGPILQRLQEKMPNSGFYNCFGQSEIAPLATVLRPEEHVERPDSAGRPVLFVELRVVDSEGAEVAPGGTGEVVYRSPQLCTGYWNKPEETEAAFDGDWFHSGDLVRIDEEGFIFVVDRIKDVINTGGVVVASREVEDALYSHPAVAEVAVIGVPDAKWIEAVHAVVVAKDAVTVEELTAYARERLAPFKVPKSIEFSDSLPRNASGKILKRELRPAE